MDRQEFPRLYELRDHVEEPESADCYLACLTRPSLGGSILKNLREREADLQGLDYFSWQYLKGELKPLLTRKDPNRAWQALCDRMNEAKGYNYLVRIGCTDVQFIPRSAVQGRTTPDLRGRLRNIDVICEVKTINTSEDETAARRNPRFAGTGLVRLPKEFFEKLKNTLVTAGRQMTCYCLSPETNRIVYVIVNYDDPLHECEREYRAQIDAFMASKPVPGLDVEFDIKPALYYLA